MGMFSCREVMRIFGRTPPADDLRGGATPVATDPRRPRDERRRRCTLSLATPFFAARVRVTRTYWRSARGRARTGAGRPRRGGGAPRRELCPPDYLACSRRAPTATSR